MWIIFLVFFFSESVSAMTDMEMKENFIKTTVNCLKDHHVEMADLIKLRALELPDNRDVKCLLACAYKKYGAINDEGKFDVEQFNKLAKKVKEGDEKAIVNAQKLADVCARVNDENVTDESTGCERAGLMFTCLTENASKFGFNLK